jgi:hypothetical protein
MQVGLKVRPRTGAKFTRLLAFRVLEWILRLPITKIRVQLALTQMLFGGLTLTDNVFADS